MSIKKYNVIDDLVVGYSEIDDQHIELFTRLNILLDAVDNKKSITEIRKFILFLSEYIKEHLRLEEQLMEKYEYPEIEKHQKEHRVFKEAYARIIEDFNAEKLGHRELIGALEAKIGDWFESHIRRTDKDAAKFILSKSSPS